MMGDENPKPPAESSPVDPAVGVSPDQQPAAPQPMLDPELQALAARASGSAASWLIWILVPVAFALGVGIGFVAFAPAEDPSALANASATPSAEPPPPPPKSTIQLASEGDFAAIDKLKEKPLAERSVEETIAIQRGEGFNKSRALKGFAEEIAGSAKALKEDAEKLQRLRDYFEDTQTMAQAAEIILKLPGDFAGDLLYEIWVGTRGQTEATEFARELLYSKGLREKVSESLSVALDLRLDPDCETAKAILPRATEEGDKRSLRLLAPFMRKTGCGDTKRDDCYACLRSEDPREDPVVEAIRAVRLRPGPKF